MASLQNERFHGWIVREAIGAGGLAEVFRVEHSDDPRSHAALKVLRPERVGDSRHGDAIEREHEIMAALSHPAIPRARRLGEIQGRPALLMDLVPGRSLVVAAGEPGFAAARIYLELLAIVAHLHEAGLAHNDLKPENVIVRPDGRIALVDFGSARHPARTSLFRRFFGKPATVFGSATYVAPELVAGHQPSYASDVYSLGVCAFVLLTGEPPFTVSRSQRLRAAATQAAPSIRERLPQLPPRLAQPIDACLAKTPMQRPRDARVLLAALTGLDAALPPLPLGTALLTKRLTRRQTKRQTRQHTKGATRRITR